MQKFELVLFDLDGTLTDPMLGITNSVIYALEKRGYNVPQRKDILFFIGPPLIDSFKEYLNVQDEEAQLLVDTYREYFSEKGIFENNVIKGAEELLSALKKSSIKIALATSKPKVFADRILEHFNLNGYFDITVGSNLNGSLTDKADVIAEVLKHFDKTEKEKIAMVGDRCFDISGAVKNEIIPIGVLCGYGDYKELKTAGAKYIADTLADLKDILI